MKLTLNIVGDKINTNMMKKISIENQFKLRKNQNSYSKLDVPKLRVIVSERKPHQNNIQYGAYQQNFVEKKDNNLQVDEVELGDL